MTVQTEETPKTHLQTSETHPDIPVGWTISRVGGVYLARRDGVHVLSNAEISAGLEMTPHSTSRAGILVLIRVQIERLADYNDNAERLKDSGSCRNI